MSEMTYDAVVVGGGAAGLSGAVALARSRRSVLVVDAGEPRNAPADGVHNYLGREGTPPQQLVADGRVELAAYGGRVCTDRVVGAVRRDDGFAIELASGAAVRARRVLLATGVRDELPDVPGLAERWGRDVVHCPFCHGWEVRDQRIGVLATQPGVAHQALLFGQLSDDVVVLRHADVVDEETERRFAAMGLRIVDGPVAGLEVGDDRLTGARLADGSVVPLDALAVQSVVRAPRELLEAFGVEVAENPMGELVSVDAMWRTAVPGVFAAGNLTDPSAQVMGSAASGTRAGAMIHADLIEADLAARLVTA